MRVFIQGSDKVEAEVYREEYVLLQMGDGWHIYNVLGIKYTDDPFDTADHARLWVDAEIATQSGQKVLN